MNIHKKVKQYYVLVKFSLSFLVVFSSVMSYLLVENIILDWGMVGWLTLGGFLITASANTLNQMIEKKTDALMERTASRPLAAGTMTNSEATSFAIFTALLGTFILAYYFNGTTALISLISLLLYTHVYTPMKKKNSLSVFVGAIPGALPCLIGWMAGNPQSIIGGIVLFSIQFIWQFPHFWAIAWIAHKDYSKAGFKLLPSVEGPSKYAAIQSIIFSLILFPLGFLPYLIGISTFASAIIIFILNILMTYLSIKLYLKMTANAARMVMFGSYIYIAILFFTLYALKI